MIWQFVYHKGPAHQIGMVETKDKADEGRAFLIAQAWCLKNNMRGPAGVKPMILADESILAEHIPAPPAQVPDPITATTSDGPLAAFGKGIAKAFR